MSERDEIAVADVMVGTRHISLKPDVVESLIESIKEIGLLNPIVVNRTPQGLELVAGLHRLTAYQRMGRAMIPATLASARTITAQMAEIDENLVRGVLTAQERGLLTAERKRLYELRHPETRHVRERGGPGRGQKTTAESAVVFPPAFTKDTATQTGRAERTVREDVQIGKAILPEVHEAIKGTELANSKGELLKLAAMPPDQQRDVADRIATKQATSVAEARKQGNEAVSDAARVLSGGGPDPVVATQREYVKPAATLSKAMRTITDLDPALVRAGIDATNLDIMRRNRDSYSAWVDKVLAANSSGVRLVR